VIGTYSSIAAGSLVMDWETCAGARSRKQYFCVGHPKEGPKSGGSAG